jgi:hypothetical protein
VTRWRVITYDSYQHSTLGGPENDKEENSELIVEMRDTKARLYLSENRSPVVRSVLYKL